MASRNPERDKRSDALQLPMLDGVSDTVPTKNEVMRVVGFITEEIYQRLLNALHTDPRSWSAIIDSFKSEDSTPDHPWS